MLPNEGVKSRKWTFKYQRILCMTIKGTPIDEIAKKVGLKPKYVQNLQYTPMFQARREKMEQTVSEQVTEYFTKHVLKAAEKIVEISKDGQLNQKMQFEASKEILYQLGIKPVNVVETRTRELTSEETASAKKTVEELETALNRLDTTRSRYIISKAEITSDATTASIQPEKVDESTEVVADGPVGPQAVSA